MSALPLLMRQQLGAASRLHSAMHAGLRLPTLDWGRFHLQLLFVDTTHGVKLRLAEGVFDAVTTWNGCAKALYPASAGVVPLGATRGVAADAEGPAVPLQAGWSTWRLGSLLPEVHALGLDSRLFAAPFRDLDAACLEGELAFFDLVVAVDAEAERAVDALIEEVFGSEPKSKAWSRRKVVRLEDFLTYLPREFALKAGASGVLGPRLRKLLETTAEDGRTLYEVATSGTAGTGDVGSAEPGGTPWDDWSLMVARTTLCVAGLQQCLMDLYPADLEEQHYF